MAVSKEAQAKPPASRFSRIISGFFFSLSVYLALVLGLSLLWPRGWTFLVGPGLWLHAVFAWASWFLPLWMLAAGFLLRSASFHPRLSYLLGAVSIPYLVAAGFARISTEPGAFFENHPFFAAVGLSSLYAGFGFLFASSLAAVGFGFVKISAWMRDTGRLQSKRDGKKTKRGAGKNGPASDGAARLGLFGGIAGLIAKARRAIQDRREKRSEAEKRLRESEAMEISSFDLDLPPPPVLRSGNQGGRADSAAPGHVPDKAARSAATGAAETADAGTSAVAGAVAGADPAAGAGRPAKAIPSATPTASPPHPITISAEGLDIEFTSVPPQSVTGASGSGSVETDDAEKKAIVQRILDRKKAAKPYSVPVDGILNTYPDGQYWIIDDKTRKSAETLRETLAEFGIEAEVTGIRKGPVITMFEILPAHGVKISKITNLSDNIALRLAASSVRIVAPIPGKHAVGIEVPNEHRAVVSLREIIEHEQFNSAKMEIPVALGKDISGGVQFCELTQTPHLLIAGATGSGKSVCVNAIILSILYKRRPEDVKLILIDPKIVELKLYNGIPHLLTPVITESKKAFQALQYCICEMERRYSVLDKAGVRDIKSYNRRVKERNLAQERLPYIVVIIDEFADLMATTGKELEATLARLAAMSRAVGIHLVLATQRPSIDVITGLIKANIPSRIAFMVASKFDSRIIIDMVGAEKLLGRGDMLYSGAQDPFPVRMQGAFVSEEEVERAVDYVKTLGSPEYIDDEIFFDEDEEDMEPGLFDGEEGDPLFEKALEIVMQQGKASASYIQRRLKIGYNRSARLVELMEQRGIVGPAQGSKPRDIIRNPEVFRPDAGGSPSARREEAEQEDRA